MRHFPPPAPEPAAASPSRGGLAPTMHPAVILAIIVTVVAAALLTPHAGAADGPAPRLRPEILMASQQQPDIHLLAAGLNERIPASARGERHRGLYSVAVVPGVPEVGIPTRTVEMAVAADGTKLYQTSDNVAPSAMLASQLLKIDRKTILPFVRLEHVVPGTRYLRIAVLRPDGRPLGVGYVLEGDDPERRAVFASLDRRVGAVLGDAPSIGTVPVGSPDQDEGPGYIADDLDH
ncbi:MAG TPA: hypothetical protein VEI97_13495 [bacterium]|nr:hypothetical protein [bacterium]